MKMNYVSCLNDGVLIPKYKANNGRYISRKSVGRKFCNFDCFVAYISRDKKLVKKNKPKIINEFYASLVKKERAILKVMLQKSPISSMERAAHF